MRFEMNVENFKKFSVHLTLTITFLFSSLFYLFYVNSVLLYDMQECEISIHYSNKLCTFSSLFPILLVDSVFLGLFFLCFPYLN